MKILFCIRKDYLTNLAGDSVQMLKTEKYLRGKGLTVYINSGEITDYSKYDIIHLFNLTRISETYEFYKIAEDSGKIIVITPIYWNLEEYYRHTGSLELIRLWKNYRQFRNEILNGCSMIYPSSKMEMNLLKSEYGSNLPFTVVYNGIDIKEFCKHDDESSKGDKYIMCAGRICPRKNQLVLAEISKEFEIDLVLVGSAGNKAYLEKCLSFKNVSWKGFLKQGELVVLYKNAMLHVLCSFLETPGLSSLEAGACGCNIVSTSEGSTEEYFEDMAVYCNPYDDHDIYNAIKTGIKFNKQPSLKKHIIEKFNLENCLDELYNSYLNLINEVIF